MKPRRVRTASESRKADLCADAQVSKTRQVFDQLPLTLPSRRSRESCGTLCVKERHSSETVGMPINYAKWEHVSGFL